MTGRTVFSICLVAIGLLIAADALIPFRFIQLVVGLLITALGGQEIYLMRTEAREQG